MKGGEERTGGEDRRGGEERGGEGRGETAFSSLVSFQGLCKGRRNA